MIKLENINFYYEDIKALDDLSLTINSGEKIVLLGNNGCGKSTLLKLLAGLIYPKSGEYIYKDKKITKKYLKQNSRDFRKDFAILFQNPDAMLFNPTVKDEIAFSLDEFEVSSSVQNIAEQFNISHLLDKSPLKLSGGEKQKVALAAIFAVEPKVLLLDEPTANLDPRSTGWLVDFLQELNITVVISTHNLSLAYELGTRAIVLDETHKIIYDGDLDTLYKDEDLLYRANLIHKHKHTHDGVEHSHFHIHNWSK